MKLPKLTRKMIYTAASKGQSVEISWPQNATEPKVAHTYSLQSGHAAGEDRIVVLSRRELATGWKVKVKLDTDPKRPLRVSASRAPEADPMGGPQFRPELEPEQVDARYQRLLTEEGRMKTVVQGAKQRQLVKVLQKEQEVADKWKTKRGERAALRHRDSAKRKLEEAT